MTNILTLRMDPEAQAFFDRMRVAHYPPELNQIAAHLTLFHALPNTSAIAKVLQQTSSSQPRFHLRVTGLRSLGRGVAYQLASQDLLGLHGVLASAFTEHLSAQDRQRFMPHVVAQNKTTPERASLLLNQLRAEFQPFNVRGLGLDLWHYLGGPWQLAERFAFTDAP